jgi:hypothetical protein
MAAFFLALALLQDPAGEEIRTLLRRLESSTGTPAETSEVMLRLSQVVEQVEPREARTLLGDAVRGDRIPPARRLDLAETLFSLDDRGSWTEEAGRIALDAAEPPETRLRAALLLARAEAPRAAEVGRALDERLFAEGTDAAAKALGTHLREGTSRDLQRLEVDYLFRLAVPAARAALREALTDDGLDPALRLEIAERLHASGGLDRRRETRAALERIKAQDAALASRVDRLLSAIREEPTARAAAPANRPATGKPSARGQASESDAGRVNLMVAGGTVIALAVLLLWRRKGPG